MMVRLTGEQRKEILAQLEDDLANNIIGIGELVKQVSYPTLWHDPNTVREIY